jgi:hypothetical protein
MHHTFGKKVRSSKNREGGNENSYDEIHSDEITELPITGLPMFIHGKKPIVNNPAVKEHAMFPSPPLNKNY